MEKSKHRAGTHLRHCDKGEYVGSCKYGETDCPAFSMKRVGVYRDPSIGEMMGILRKGPRYFIERKEDIESYTSAVSVRDQLNRILNIDSDASIDTEEKADYDGSTRHAMVVKWNEEVPITDKRVTKAIKDAEEAERKRKVAQDARDEYALNDLKNRRPDLFLEKKDS